MSKLIDVGVFRETLVTSDEAKYINLAHSIETLARADQYLICEKTTVFHRRHGEAMDGELPANLRGLNPKTEY